MASPELLDLPASRGRLHALCEAGLLGEGELEHALVGLRATQAGWLRAIRWHALIVGIVLLVSGAIFFVAANWSALSGTARMALVGLPMLLAFGVGGFFGDASPGRAATLLGGLLFGPLLAVFGQVYQTGADAWQLFAWWTLVLVVTAGLTRFVGTWITALLALHVATFAWIDQELGSSPYEGKGAWVLAGLALLDGALVSLAQWRQPAGSRVLVHVAASFGLLVLLPLALVALLDEPSEGSLPGLLVLASGLVAIWLTYRWRRPEIGMLAIFAGYVTVLSSSLLGRILLIEADLELFGLALLGLLVSVQVWWLTRWLLHWRREQLAYPDERRAAP